MQTRDFKVTLLGTGKPDPTVDRFGPSTLVEAGTQKLLIDDGRGVPIRLWQLKVPVGQIDAPLLTHFHSDHTAGIPDVWLTGWIQLPWGGRTTPFRVIGPMGTKSLMSNLEAAYALDVKIRIADEESPPQGVAVAAEEFTKDGVVYAKDGGRGPARVRDRRRRSRAPALALKVTLSPWRNLAAHCLSLWDSS
jgi:ribonuclease Z